ncbi:response regulator transcription factor [Clostridium sp. AM58-1XD]|uniref:response regulator transcription factor n=1 Tax=Clostridium sp. AM58-1XD TaxID=2292307 RepID=UPI0026796FCE
MDRKIYIADDEEAIRKLIRSFLVNEGYEVCDFPDGVSLMEAFEKEEPDLVILDVMMPGVDGFQICAEIRQKSTVPILIVSAKDSPLDRVTGITLGSDDYMVKPFLPLELVARVRALFRRMDMGKRQQNTEEEIRLEYGDLCLDLKTRLVFLKGVEFPLTPTEFDFIVYMAEHRDRAVEKKELLKNIWKFDGYETDTRAVDDMLKRLGKS